MPQNKEMCSMGGIQKNLILEGLTEKEAKEFKVLFTKFMQSYSKKEQELSDTEWLSLELKNVIPDLSNVEAKKMAEDTVEAIKEYDENLASLNYECKQGKSKEKWFTDKVAKASSGVSIIEYGQYLDSVNRAVSNANAQMLRTVTTKTGEINQCFNLDGFIAEQHHVNTFNANAALAKSKFYAEVKVPEAGETYGLNSFDVVIKDSSRQNNMPVHQYQVKYGADADATIKLLREHGEVTKYSNQRIVVPYEQVEKVQKAFPGKTVVAQIGGTDKVAITSEPLSKQQAKELQLKVQEKNEIPTTDWNSFKTKELALQLGKNAGMAGIQAAAITTGFSLAEQVISGEGIDADETVELALTTGADVGIKAAASGALVAGVQKGIISVIPKGTPVGIIANATCVGIENIKILGKVAGGEFTMSQGLEHMGRTTTAMIYGLGWGKAGMAIGAAALSWIPIVGPVVGGLVGGMVGHMAGSSVGQGIFEGVKAVGKGVKTVCSSAWNGIKSVAGKIGRSIFG